jgi:hypothetical protein
MIQAGRSPLKAKNDFERDAALVYTEEDNCTQAHKVILQRYLCLFFCGLMQLVLQIKLIESFRAGSDNFSTFIIDS